MSETKIGGGAGAATPAAVATIRDEVGAQLNKLELSSEPPEVMVDKYRAILAKAADLPPAAQWEVTYQAISVLTAIEAARDAPGPIRAFGRFMRRMTQLLGDGGIGSLLRSSIRGGPSVHADAEVALAKIARAPDEQRIQALIETSPGLLPPGVDQVRLPVDKGALLIQRAASDGNTVTLEDAKGAPQGKDALLAYLKDTASPLAQEFARELRRAIAASAAE